MQKNSNLIIAIAVILVILGAVAFMLDSRKNQDKSNAQQGDNINPADSNNVAYNNYTQEGVDETPEEELATAPPSGQTPTQPARLTYDQLLTIYGSAGNNSRFQFIENCQSIPESLTVKWNSRFVLDNRDSEPHTFKIGIQTIHLNKYAFAVVTAKQRTELDIVCDGVSRAKLKVQQ
jgi:hypothetical protein